MPRTLHAPAVPPTTWLEADLGDTEFKVDEHSDGMFTIDVPDDRLVLNAEQMKGIVQAFARIGLAKGWLASILIMAKR